jgi:fluoride exporter
VARVVAAPAPGAPPRPTGRRLAAVAAGGAVGTALRAAFLEVFPPTEGAFPVTVLTENVAGAFVLGVVVALLLWRRPDAVHLHAFLTTGVLGSFTTFSAVALDLVVLLEGGRFAVAVGYLSASLVVGLVAAVGGLAVGRRISVGRRMGGGA